jgi:FkbM family methyltransferase
VISGNIAFNGVYEWGLSRRIAGQAKTGGLFVDVGANMGYFSLVWAALSRAGTVIAFEAAPRNIQLFRKNVEQNHLLDRITLVSKAVGTRTGGIAFDLGPADQTGWGGISYGSCVDNVEVPLVRLDEALPATNIDVLKIDVEGADTFVLQGCEGLLRDRRIRMIYFEQNVGRMKQLGISPGEAQGFLRSFGYECRSMGRGGGEWLAYPR